MGKETGALCETSEEIERLVHEFERCTLPPDRWTHAAHLTVALWYLTRWPVDEATTRIRCGIRAYNASRGLPSTPAGGYHETVTLFYVAVVVRYLRDADSTQPLPELLMGLMREYGHKRLLSQHYSRPRLLSDAARTGWVAPDLQALD